MFFFMIFLVEKATSYVLSDCHFANQYTSDQLFLSSELQEEFIMRTCYWEGKFAVDEIGVRFTTGLTDRGIDIYSGAGQYLQHANYTDNTSDWTSWQRVTHPQDEAVHLALLVLGLKEEKYVLEFWRSALQSSNSWTNSTRDFFNEQLTKKIGYYEQFNTEYPGFGGYLPWIIGVEDDGFRLVKKDNGHRVTTIDGAAHGALCWAMVAAVQALHDTGNHDLAIRYNRHLKRLAKYGRLLFNVGQLSPSTMPRQLITVINASSAPHKANVRDCDEKCFAFYDVQYFDVALFTSFIYYLTEWPNNTTKREYRHAMRKSNRHGITTYKTSRNQSITVEKQVFFTADDRLLALFLPFLDVPIAEELFLNGENARTHYSNDHNVAGLFAAIWNLAYYPSILRTSIHQLAAQYSYPNYIIATYAAFPLISHPKTRPYGLSWLLTVMKGPRMQGPMGITPGITTEGDKISIRQEWIQKSVIVLAFSGGVVNLTRQYLKSSGRYEEFLRNVENDYAKLLGTTKIKGKNVPFALPLHQIPNDGSLFPYCDDKDHLIYCDSVFSCAKVSIEAVLNAMGIVTVATVLYLSLIVNRDERGSYKYFIAHIFTLHLLELVANFIWVSVELTEFGFVRSTVAEYILCLQWYVQMFILPMCFITMASVTVLSVSVSIVFPLRYQRLFSSASRWHFYMGCCYLFAVASTFTAVRGCNLTVPLFPLKQGLIDIMQYTIIFVYVLPLLVTVISGIIAGVAFYTKAVEKGDIKKATKLLMSLLNYSFVPLLWSFGTQELDNGDDTDERLEMISYCFRVSFGVSHSIATLVTLPPIRRAFLQMIRTGGRKFAAHGCKKCFVKKPETTVATES